MFYLLPIACRENPFMLERLAKIVFYCFFGFFFPPHYVDALVIFWTNIHINKVSFVLYEILLLWLLLSTLQHSIMYHNPLFLTICSFLELNTSQKFSYISYEFEATKCLSLFQTSSLMFTSQIFVLYMLWNFASSRTRLTMVCLSVSLIMLMLPCCNHLSWVFTTKIQCLCELLELTVLEGFLRYYSLTD